MTNKSLQLIVQSAGELWISYAALGCFGGNRAQALVIYRNSEREMKYPIDGSCQCGGVTYQLLSEPLMVMACHCKECQKLSTSAFSITAVVRADAVEFHGEMVEWTRIADSGNVNGAKFCPTCGNRIYHFNPKEPEKIKLKPSNLSDTRIIKPTAHVWISEKQDWYSVPEGVTVYDKQP